MGLRFPRLTGYNSDKIPQFLQGHQVPGSVLRALSGLIYFSQQAWQAHYNLTTHGREMRLREVEGLAQGTQLGHREAGIGAQPGFRVNNVLAMSFLGSRLRGSRLNCILGQVSTSLGLCFSSHKVRGLGHLGGSEG